MARKHTHPQQMKVQQIQKKLGKQLYVFESSTTTHRCMITAHGGYWFGTGKFTVPANVSVHFYNPHGTKLSDPGLEFLKSAKYMNATETIAGGSKCYDYSLSKYQGRHGRQAETYEAIANSVKGGDERLELFQKNLNTVLDKDTPNDKGVIALLRGAGMSRNAHVVTIRSRWFNINIQLSYVIKMVLKSYPEVTEFHCSHCRSNMLPF